MTRTTKLWPKLIAFMMIFSFLLPYASAIGEKETAKRSLEGRISQVELNYNRLKKRVDDMHDEDPKKTTAVNKVDSANDTVTDFTSMQNLDNYLESTGGDNWGPTSSFDEKEDLAVQAINEVNQYLIRPIRPGAKTITGGGTVPKGDIIEGFAPQIIRLLLRFASLAVFISFVISGVYFVAAFGNEERVTKGKNMLYYSLIGFVIVSLAFAIVKAITDIDFFNFI